MHSIIQQKRRDLADLCRRFGVARLDVFGSATRGADFGADSDVDFLVEFKGPQGGLTRLLDFQDALAALLGRPVDLVDRKAIVTSRNYIRRKSILDGAEVVYAA